MKELKTIMPENVIAQSGDQETLVNKIEVDSRRVEPGDMFVALKGEQFDGNDYIESATGAGAAAIVSEKEPWPECSLPWLQVEDARISLARIAKKFYDHPDRELKLTGITGTNGKTTTAHIISSFLQVLHGPCGVLGTVSHQLGQQTIQARLTTQESHENLMMMAEMRRNGCRSAVMEASSVGIHRYRVHSFDWDCLVFTNFTRDHLDYHGSMEEYFAAKESLFHGYADKKPQAVLNFDDPQVKAMASRLDLPVTGFGVDEAADLRLLSADLTASKSCLAYSWQGKEFECNSPLIGRFNAQNLTAALAAVLAQGFSPEDILPLIPGLTAVSGRLEPIDIDMPYKVLIDYAHTDDALLKLLETAREITSGRLIVLFGCGGDRDKSKRPQMGAHAVTLADLAVLTSDNPRTEDPEAIIDDVLAGINRVDDPRAELHVETDRRKAIAWTLSQAEAGDMILLAGKGHEPYQIIGKETFPFDERVIVKDILENQ